jgi:hypothetical protein
VSGNVFDSEPPRDRIAFLATPAAVALFQFAFAAGYGIFRDELYYLACADHLGWGDVDHPPLSILILKIVRALFGDSIHALRLAPAIAAGFVAALAAGIARGLGGGSFAQRLAALAAGTFPLGIAFGAFYSMNVFDVLFWTAALRVVVAILAGGDPRLWLAFGAIAGIGLQNKISVLFLGLGLAAGIVAARRFDLLRTRWIWLGALVATALFAPHIVWQAAHGWPTLEFMDNARRLKMARLSPLGFLGQQLIMAGPVTLFVWVAGVWFLFRNRTWRSLGWTYVAVLVVMIAQGAKPYYLGPVYPVLFAAGGVWWERASEVRRWIRPVGIALVLAAAAALTPLAKPILPVEAFIEYEAALGIRSNSGERHTQGRLPQQFADMHGWKELAETVAAVKRGLPAEEQAKVCVFGQNYGEAGAIDRFGPALGLPRAMSGHNSYWLWGPHDCEGATWLVIGDDRETLETIFESVTLGATFNCDLCMPYENDNPIWIGRGPKVSIRDLWPKTKKYV